MTLLEQKRLAMIEHYDNALDEAANEAAVWAATECYPERDFQTVIDTLKPFFRKKLEESSAIPAEDKLFMMETPERVS